MAERFDLEAIAADDALLDRLAAGGEALYDALDAGGDDPAVRLLGELRLAVEVVEDERPGWPADELEQIPVRSAGRGLGTDPLARKIAARTLALGVAAVAGLSVSGVAAAVTGDPLSPYEKIVEKVVDELRPQSTFPIKSVGGVVSSKSASEKAVTEYRKTVENQGDQARKPAPTDRDEDRTVAVDPFRSRIDLNRPPLVEKEPILTDRGNKPTEPLQKDEADGDTGQTDDTTTRDRTTELEPTDDSTLQPPETKPSSEPIAEPTPDPTPEPTPDPTTEPPRTEPSPTPSQGEGSNQPNTGGGDETNAGTGGDAGAGTGEGGTNPSENKTDSGSPGAVETQAPEDRPAGPTPPATTQPSQPADPPSSDPADKPSDETSVPGAGSDRRGDADHSSTSDSDRFGDDGSPTAPGELATEVVRQILATLNSVMGTR